MITKFFLLGFSLLLTACPKSQDAEKKATQIDTQNVKKENHSINDFYFTEGIYKYTSLGIACKEGNLEKVKQLLLQGANKEEVKQDEYLIYDALFVAIENNHLPIVSYLVENNAEINKPYTEDLLTPLALACRMNNEKIVSYLLKKGAYVDGMQSSLTDYKEIPLLIAIENNNFQIAKLLLEAGANINLLDNNGTPIKNILMRKKGKEWEELISTVIRK